MEGNIIRKICVEKVSTALKKGKLQSDSNFLPCFIATSSRIVISMLPHYKSGCHDKVYRQRADYDDIANYKLSNMIRYVIIITTLA